MSLTAPLQSMLAQYADAASARFHMPGHKGRACGSPADAALPIDITELSFSDDLHDPQCVLAEAERSIARAFGAYRSFILVNGSTAGVLAALLAFGDGARVLMARDCHRSFVSGLALSGAQCVPLSSRWTNGEHAPACANDVAEALASERFDAVALTYPDYYGRCFDIARVADAVRRSNALLLIDCAHGAHNAFSHCFTSPAQYADIWVTSLHKTLPALSQCAVLNVSHTAARLCGGIQAALRMVQTSSPSYVLMASCEHAVNCASALDWNAHLERIRSVIRRINAIDGIFVPDFSDTPSVCERDPLRLCVRLEECDGFSAMRLLEQRNVYVEMADANTLVLITSPLDPDEWYDMLLRALAELPRGAHAAPIPPPPARRSSSLNFRSAMLSRSASVPLEDAVGRTAAQPVGAYPPGNAVVLPSEVFMREDIEYLLRLRELGCALFGVDDGKVACVEARIDI
ncbi:MAG: hypothetical protein Q4B99_00395 [Clostridia bacterium]|nr:hypothetical protein [Clostridia bacterium]